MEKRHASTGGESRDHPDAGEHHDWFHNLGFIGEQFEGDKVAVDNFHARHSCHPHNSPSKALTRSPSSVEMAGAIIGNPLNWKTPDDQQVKFSSSISSLEAELEKARARIHELETEQQSSKKKVDHLLSKLAEEMVRAAWRNREHEKVRAILDDIKSDLNQERKNRERLEIDNSKLVKELADAKSSVKLYMQEYEKERKGRELIEEVCDELANKIEEDKAEIEALRRESMELREEVEDDTKILQMAEDWREERVQMTLIDAKVILEEKYTQMNWLIAAMKSFLISKDAAPGKEAKFKAELLHHAADQVKLMKRDTNFLFTKRLIHVYFPPK